MKKTAVIIALLMGMGIGLGTQAANTPCSGKKGGVSHCLAGKFICNDGSMSQSKRTCIGVEKKGSKKK